MFQNILLMNENDRSDLLSNNNKCMYVGMYVTRVHYDDNG